MPALPPELRLLHLLALNAAVLGAACRFAKKKTAPDRLTTCVDALLIWYAVQYLSIALPGLLGSLGPASMTLTAAGLAGALWWAAGRADPLPAVNPLSRSELWSWSGASALVLALLGVLVWRQWILPPQANDPLTYHLPAAAEWLQTGRIGTHQTWLFNPANTYSPLGGSAFLAWLIGPVGNDVAARFGQVPAALLLFLAVGQLARGLGAGPAAAVIGLAAVLGRPAMSQTTLAKDDLFVAALFATAAAGLARDRLKDEFAPWRIGTALGLMLAIKFTALLALPVLLLATDAPWRAGWRLKKYAITAAVAAALAGPWYLRNLLEYGNPLFPVAALGMPGLFTTARAVELRSIAGAWRTITGGYAGATVPLAIALLAVWGAAWSGWKLLRDPLSRLVLIGPVVGIGLFLALSPYPEPRFLLPSFTLLTAAAALASRFGRLSAWVAAGLLATVAAATGFAPGQLLLNLPAAAVAAVVLLAVWVVWRRLNIPRLRAAVALSAGLLAAGWVYVQWAAVLSTYRQNTALAWGLNYGGLGEAWNAVRDRTPADATVAYGGTHFTYPLMGFDLDRRVVYAPSRPGLTSVADLGWLGGGLAGLEIDKAASAAAAQGAGERVWRENLKRSGAGVLFLAKPAGPEAGWAEGAFEKVFENGKASIYVMRQ